MHKNFVSIVVYIISASPVHVAGFLLHSIVQQLSLPAGIRASLPVLNVVVKCCVTWAADNVGITEAVGVLWKPYHARCLQQL